MPTEVTNDHSKFVGILALRGRFRFAGIVVILVWAL